MKIYRAFLVFVASWLASYSLAKDDKKINYQKKTKLSFEEKSVDGEFMRPDAKDVDGDNNLEFGTLMNPRKDFRKELKRSVGAVR